MRTFLIILTLALPTVCSADDDGFVKVMDYADSQPDHTGHPLHRRWVCIDGIKRPLVTQAYRGQDILFVEECQGTRLPGVLIINAEDGIPLLRRYFARDWKIELYDESGATIGTIAP